MARQMRMRQMRGWAAALVLCLLAAAGAALAQEPPDAALYTVLITQPADGETVFDNEGNVAIRFHVVPSLRSEAGHQLLLSIDGLPFAPVSAAGATLRGVERGPHTLTASVVDSGGKLLASSSRASFYLWQASALFPNRRAK